MARIAVVNVPFFSHVGAAARLTAALVRQGHTVLTWGPDRHRERIVASGAEFRLHQPEMPAAVGFAPFAASLAATTEEVAEPLMEELLASKVELVVHDSQVPWARVAAEFLGLPRVVSHPMFPVIVDRRVVTDAERDAPEESPLEALDSFESSWLAISRRWGVEFDTWGSLVHSSGDSDATIAFTTERIVGVALDSRWHCVGPLMEAIPRSETDGGRPLVYVCFGTSFNRRPAQFRAVIDALAGEPFDVIVSLGGAKFPPAELGAPPANVVVESFAPGREVLARAHAHVTHGGCNSVHESLLAGVPMVCVPQAYDQFPLVERIEALGAARVAPEEPEAIRDAVRLLLADESAGRCAEELGRHLGEYDGESRVARLFEELLADAAGGGRHAVV